MSLEMFDGFTALFFQILKNEAERQLGADHPCIGAIGRAADTNAPADIENARQKLAALPASALEPLMAMAHKMLRETPPKLPGDGSKQHGGPVDPSKLN